MQTLFQITATWNAHFIRISAKLVIINNSGDKQTAKIPCNGELFKFVLEPYEMIVRKL